MDSRNIRSVLQDALEDEIPSSKINLWPAIKADLAAGKHRVLQGENMNTVKSNRMPRLAYAMAVMIALMAVALVTPQGRSFAQGIVQFFTRAESNTFLLSASQIATSETDIAAPTVAAPAPLTSAAEAGKLAGFQPYELPSVPDGFTYLGARLYGSAVSIEYEAQGGGGNLIIMQSTAGVYQSSWDQVPAEAVVPVKIGQLDGEFAQGAFVVYAGDSAATWNPDAQILRLRWLNDGVWLEMSKYGGVDAIEYLDQAGMVALAESMAINR